MWKKRLLLLQPSRYYSTRIKKPQYDLKSLKHNAESFQKNIEKRRINFPFGTVPQLTNAYNELVQVKLKRDQLLQERNQMQQRIKADKTVLTNDMKDQLSQLKLQINSLEDTVQVKEKPIMEAIDSIPNLISPDVEHLDDIQEIERLNPSKFIPTDMENRDHVTISKKMGDIVDFNFASNVSGTSWYYLLDRGVQLEMALVQYALSRVRSFGGWKMVIPPAAIRPKMASSCGFKPRDQNDEQQIYPVGDNLCLAGTAEIPLAGLGLNINSLNEIPGTHHNNDIKRVVGISRAYRAEAGARGKDTKGLYRVHEFTKVELFSWCVPEKSQDMLNEILALQKDIIGGLGLCSRILNMPPFELGAPAYKKFDIEAWMPGRGDWGEVSSASNCLDYQSRRLHTKCQDGETFAHTLNGTAMAVPRVMVAIIENYYDPLTNKILIPERLRPFMNNQMYL